MSKENIFSRFLFNFFPGAYLARENAQFRAMQIRAARTVLSERGYDGAAKGRRTDGWKRTNSSANSEVRKGVDRLRSASRDLIRNNAWAKKAQSVVTSHVVGNGISAEVQTINKKKLEKTKSLWLDFSESTACDFDGKYDFFGLESLIMDTVFESGSCLIRRRKQKYKNGKTVPLKVQILEPDFLDTTKNGSTTTGGFLMDGIEYDAEGILKGYWLYSQHPGENIVGISQFKKSFFVPAEDIIHVFRVDRPGQSNGVPWLHPVILRMKDLDDAHDAYLLRQKIAACFGVFITDENAGSDAEAQKILNQLADKVEPGGIEILPQGRSISFANPPGVDGFSDFSDDELHYMAAGIGITFESLTTKLDGVSFLSGRMGQLDMNKNISRWQSNMFIPQACNGIFKWFLEAGQFLGGAGPDEAWATWIVPQRDMVDPEKEFKVLKDKVRSGLPLFDMLRSLGYTDPEGMLKKKSEENKLLDDLGIVLDTDPRKTSAAGNPVADPASKQQPDSGGSASSNA